MSEWHHEGIYYWLTWSNSDTDYQYAIRLACNNATNERVATFNLFNSQPNANPPDGYEKFAVINGSIGHEEVAGWYNVGGPVSTYSYQVKQNVYETTPPDYDYLVMTSSGGGNFYFSTCNNGANAWSDSIVLGCPAKANGIGEDGCNGHRSHAFIGTGTLDGNTINYMGYTTGTDASESSGATGSEIVTKMTGKYGGTCAILDGGGSTQMWYNGAIERYSTDSGGVRLIPNAICLYRKARSAEQPGIKIKTASGLKDLDSVLVKPKNVEKIYIKVDGELKEVYSAS